MNEKKTHFVIQKTYFFIALFWAAPPLAFAFQR
jgi:hypothetical protein